MSTRADSPFRDSRRDTREPLPGIGVISYPWQVLGLLQPRGVNRTSSPSHAGHFGTAAMPVEAIMSRFMAGVLSGNPPERGFSETGVTWWIIDGLSLCTARTYPQGHW